MTTQEENKKPQRNANKDANPKAGNEAENLHDEGLLCVDEEWRLNQIATDFATALLQNPNIERYLRNPPLSDLDVEDGLSQGQWLAKKCSLMAKDFIEELEKDS